MTVYIHHPRYPAGGRWEQTPLALLWVAMACHLLGVAPGWFCSGGSHVPTLTDASQRHAAALGTAEQPLLPTCEQVNHVPFVVF